MHPLSSVLLIVILVVVQLQVSFLGIKLKHFKLKRIRN